MAASISLYIIQFDISTAFLNGKIDEDVFMERPTGMELQTRKCLKLNKGLYGLKQAARAWNTRLNEVVMELGLTPTQTDPCLYSDTHNETYVTMYVDDGLIIGRDESKCRDILSKLGRAFKIE